MEWLKAILEKAEIKDGKLDVEALMSTINVEAPKNVMPKAEYNNINKQLKEANDTIKDLKKDNGDNEALQAKVKEYEDTIKNQKADYEAKVRNLTLDSAIEKALTSSKAKHTDLLSGRIDRGKLVIGEDGKVTGLDEQIKGLKESYKDLFDEKISGNTPVNPEKGSLGNNTYESLMANADKMTAEEVAAQFMAIQNNK